MDYKSGAAAKVIIVTYGFPPYIKSLGGSIRMLKLAEYFVDQGLDALVICASTPHRDTFGYGDALQKIRTKTCHDPVATLAQRVAVPGNPTTGSPSSRASLLSRLKRWIKPVALDMMVPDTSFLVVRRMVQAVEEELQAASGPVTVITSGPPHSVHLVGKQVKSNHADVNWILDYRDSWNGTSLFRKKNRLLQRYNAYLERNCLLKADHLTYISAPMLRKAEIVAGRPLSGKASLVSNGYDERLQPAVAGPSIASQRPLKIGYFGALDEGEGSYRDPSGVFTALDSLPENSIQLIVHGPSALNESWQDRLGMRLLNGGRLAHSEAIQRMADMDALLLLHTREDGADEVITGKVFEYISTGLPIISVGPHDMAVNALLSDDPAFHWVSHTDNAGIKALLTELVRALREGQAQRRDPARIRAYSRTAQHEKFRGLVSKQAA